MAEIQGFETRVVIENIASFDGKCFIGVLPKRASMGGLGEYRGVIKFTGVKQSNVSE